VNPTIEKTDLDNGSVRLHFQRDDQSGKFITLKNDEWEILKHNIIDYGDVRDEGTGDFPMFPLFDIDDPTDEDLFLIDLERQMEDDNVLDLKDQLLDKVVEVSKERELVRRLVGVIEDLLER